MKRTAFLKYIYAHGCRLDREGGSHTLYKNPFNGKKSAIPRHIELPDTLCNTICKQLGIEKIK